jgi:glycopeptide antibiotics resistance protein
LSILPDKERKLSKLMVIAVAVSFVMSSVIEVSQVIFCVGTLQISDLVYNTISGAMGAVVYYVVRILQHYRARYQVQVM